MLKTTAHIVRRCNRRNANGAFGLGTTTPSYAWDFVNNKARFNSINYGALSNTPGWSYTRASAGYAQTSAGVLTYFPANLLSYSEDFGNAAWAKYVGGTAVGQTLTFVNSGSYFQQGLPAAGGTWTTGEIATVRFKASIPSGTTTMQVRLVDNSDGVPAHNTNIALTTTPTYFEINQTLGAGITAGQLGILFHGNSVITPGTVVTITELQIERAASAHTYIPTTANPVGLLRRTDKGVLIEGARTNLCLWSDDWTNAAWTKTTCTAALDQIGPDSVANSATSLTATAGNATVLQSITSGSATRAASVYIKRITGSGNIQMTVDGGAGWTTLTVTSSWTQVAITQAAVTNPNFGLRIVTNGDAVAVKFGMVESAGFQSSPIPTTTASATRAADVLTVPVSGIAYPVSLYAEFERVVDTGGSESLFHIDNGANNDEMHLFVASNDRPNLVVKFGGATQANINPTGAIALTTVTKFAARTQTNSAQLARGGSLGTEATTVTVPAAPTRVNFNRTDIPSFGYLRRAALWPRALTDSELQSVTL